MITFFRLQLSFQRILVAGIVNSKILCSNQVKTNKGLYFSFCKKPLCFCIGVHQKYTFLAKGVRELKKIENSAFKLYRDILKLNELEMKTKTITATGTCF